MILVNDCFRVSFGTTRPIREDAALKRGLSLIKSDMMITKLYLWLSNLQRSGNQPGLPRPLCIRLERLVLRM